MNATDTETSPHGFVSKHVVFENPMLFGELGSEWSEWEPVAFDNAVTFIDDEQRPRYKADLDRVRALVAKIDREHLLAFLLRHTWVCEADRKRVADLRRLAADLQMRMWWPVRRVA